MYLQQVGEGGKLVFLLSLHFNPGPAEPRYALPLQTV